MSNDRIQYGLPESHDPTPEEIERLMKVGKRLQNQAFRDIPRGAISRLTRVFRGREVGSAHSNGVTNHARAA